MNGIGHIHLSIRGLKYNMENTFLLSLSFKTYIQSQSPFSLPQKSSFYDVFRCSKITTTDVFIDDNELRLCTSSTCVLGFCILIIEIADFENLDLLALQNSIQKPNLYMFNLEKKKRKKVDTIEITISINYENSLINLYHVVCSDPIKVCLDPGFCFRVGLLL